jgi:hypothetical protein
MLSAMTLPSSRRLFVSLSEQPLIDLKPCQPEATPVESQQESEDSSNEETKVYPCIIHSLIGK